MNRIEEHRNAGKRGETWREGTRKTGRETSSKYDFDDDRPSGLTAFRRRVNPFISVAPFYIRAHANSLGFPRGFFLSPSFLCALFLSLFFFSPLFFSILLRLIFPFLEIFDFRLSFRLMLVPFIPTVPLDSARFARKLSRYLDTVTVGNNWLRFFLLFSFPRQRFYASSAGECRRISNLFDRNFVNDAIICKLRD